MSLADFITVRPIGKEQSDAGTWMGTIQQGRTTMSDFIRYRRKQIAELRPYVPFENLHGVSVSPADKEAGSPLMGDMIARNPNNHADQWLVAAQYFADNFEPM